MSLVGQSLPVAASRSVILAPFNACEIYQRQDEKYQRYNKQARNAVLVRHSQHGSRKRNDDQQGRDDGADRGVKYRPVERRGPTRRENCSPTAKLRCADINHARARRGEGRPFKKHLILLSNR